MMVGALAATLDQAVFLRMEASAEVGGAEKEKEPGSPMAGGVPPT